MADRNFLKEWQAKHDLVADGILGNKTITAMMKVFHIPGRKDFLSFIAQIQHESVSFTKHRENMNYTPDALINTFNTRLVTRFTPAMANKYGRTSKHPANQEMIASIAYAYRGGNGDAATGDGWRYRGGGGMHTTFKNNYQAYFRYAGLPMETDPEILGDPDHFFMSAKFWFDDNDAWKYTGDTSTDAIKRLSNLINAGNADRTKEPNGLDSRITLTRNLYDKFATV